MKVFTYSDGSGNTYIVTPNSIEYKPVTPQLSSSGFYNGGTYKKKEISEAEYKNITDIINEAISDTRILITNRVMGSGQIKIQDNNNISVYILKPNEEMKNKIEKYLLNFII